MSSYRKKIIRFTVLTHGFMFEADAKMKLNEPDRQKLERQNI